MKSLENPTRKNVQRINNLKSVFPPTFRTFQTFRQLWFVYVHTLNTAVYILISEAYLCGKVKLFKPYGAPCILILCYCIQWLAKYTIDSYSRLSVCVYRSRPTCWSNCVLSTSISIAVHTRIEYVFYPRNASDAWVLAVVVCLSVCASPRRLSHHAWKGYK